MNILTRVLCFVCGIYAYLVVVVQARYVNARDMSCPSTRLHSRPYGSDATMTIYLSVVDAYSRSAPPLCKLEVRVPQITNMYQAMKLASLQHDERFNFSARSDELVGFTIQHINDIWTKRHVAGWILYDGGTGKRIRTSIVEVLMESRQSYVWVYSGHSAVENSQSYTGTCVTTRDYPIRGGYPSTDIAMYYLSVQFWTNTWPLCNIPVLFVGYAGVNLNDLMMETARQYRHLFAFQRYPNFEIFDINELHGNDEYSWKAQIADKERELENVLYLVPLEDGDHVIWRYVNDLGEARRKTVKPGVENVVTPSTADDTPNDQDNNQEDNNNENTHGTADSRTGAVGSAASRRYFLSWRMVGISTLLLLTL